MVIHLTNSEASSVAQSERVLWREIPDDSQPRVVDGMWQIEAQDGHPFTFYNKLTPCSVFRSNKLDYVENELSTVCPCQPGSPMDLKETWRVGAWKENIQSIAIDYKADLFPLRKWIKIVNGAWFDRLVAESRKDAHFSNCYRETDSSGNDIEYMWTPGKSPCRWHSPVTMPRAAVRWHTTVKSVEVEQRDGKWRWKIEMEER